MILVTGASGTNGIELIKLLSQRGLSVRGMVRRPRTHSDTALSNVEYITADFDDAASLHRALEGVERVFLVTNSTERVEEQQLRLLKLRLRQEFVRWSISRSYTRQKILLKHFEGLDSKRPFV